MRSRWTLVTTLTAAILAAVSATGCHRTSPPDAYGNVEATEIVVSAEASGRLLTLPVEEGQRLDANAVVGSIDPTPLLLERDQLTAERAANASHSQEIGDQAKVIDAQRSAAEAQQAAATAQKAALEAELEIAQRDYARTQRLAAQQAATAQQLDDAERQVRVLQDQIKAQDQQIASQGDSVEAAARQLQATHPQQQSAEHQTASVDAQIAQVNDRIAKSQVRNPTAGTVLVTYAKGGEVVAVGQPLYKIADLSGVDVRAYVTEPQLAAIRLGQMAHVAVDAVGARQTRDGAITWIASQAEFTPTPIQTRDERADLVYAVKIHVPNQDGLLKIGMPVDVTFRVDGQK